MLEAQHAVFAGVDTCIISPTESQSASFSYNKQLRTSQPLQAREASKQYYMEAERIMALQVSALLFATGIFVAAHFMKIFTTAGSSTPLIPAVTTVRRGES